METCLWWTTRESRVPWGIQRSGGARPHAPAVDPDRWDITVVPNMPACLIPWENPWFLGSPGPCWPVGCCFFWSSHCHLSCSYESKVPPNLMVYRLFFHSNGKFRGYIPFSLIPMTYYILYHYNHWQAVYIVFRFHIFTYNYP